MVLRAGNSVLSAVMALAGAWCCQRHLACLQLRSTVLSKAGTLRTEQIHSCPCWAGPLHQRGVTPCLPSFNTPLKAVARPLSWKHAQQRRQSGSGAFAMMLAVRAAMASTRLSVAVRWPPLKRSLRPAKMSPGGGLATAAGVGTCREKALTPQPQAGAH